MAGVRVFEFASHGSTGGGRGGMSIDAAMKQFEQRILDAERALGCSRQPYTGYLGTGFLVGDRDAEYRVIVLDPA